MMKLKTAWCAAVLLAAITTTAHAELRLPSLFSDHMVLQREMKVPVWGWADPGAEVAVVFGDQTKTTTADDQGQWRVELEPLSIGEPRSLVVESKDDRLEVSDVLVGDVWICSGQSNMEWPIERSSSRDLEVLGEGNPDIRLLTIHGPGEQTPAEDIDGAWEECKPGTLRSFSAVGYYFGKRIHQATGVPIGLIDNSWGGSSCEAWLPLDKLSDEQLYGPLLDRWEEMAAQNDEAALRKEFAKVHDAWKEKMRAAVKAGEPIPGSPRPSHSLLTQNRPANLYNSRVAPLTSFPICGVIWYQGESNAGRAEQYRDMFPLMIETWREAWGQGDFPFYWVQLADFRDEKPNPEQSDWAELREAQTMALDRLPNSGEAVIIDVGEGKDIHPKDKQSVGDRLARHALANQYGIDIAHKSPRLESFEVKDGKIVLTFDHCRSLTTFDTRELQGFAIAGSDKHFVWAEAKINDDNKRQIIVSSPEVPEPVAVRYAWADNPVCNVYSASGLPLTPFRTDDWPGVTTGKR
ncbi:sialate O-acetylesterase [Aeoliella sp. ICT_H6.2]|uniref:Sialate O-acetylesterase n=1 Tax=Aeoliella straminimaris TaxID=2954799 RepID=A0A9X2FBX9_9BACT|nr:sialate O-acetylesterase [Aeoliella straminimaris]MCO6045338.1 sialate O-acetylesterase [Aeoliella straminimaris]